MQQARLRSTIPMACPQCETELDGVMGTCPACFWVASPAPAEAPGSKPDAMSYSERYGGAPAGSQTIAAEGSGSGVSRGRLFIIVGLVASLLLAVLVWETMAIA